MGESTNAPYTPAGGRGDAMEECKTPLQCSGIAKTEDHGGAEDGKVSSAATTGKPWFEYADTVLSLLTFLALGFNFSILCQTLIDLEKITNANTNEISDVFLWRGIGQSLACIFLGFLFDYFNHNLIISLCMVLMAACQVSMPFQTNAVVLSVIFGIQAVGIGLISVGVTLILVRIWKTKSGPFLQAQYLMYVIAGCISPLIINAFVRIDIKNNEPTDTSYIHNNTSGSLMSHAAINDTISDSWVSEYNVPLSGNFTGGKMDITQTNQTLVPTHDIIPVYSLCTSYMVIISIMCISMAFIVGPICVKTKNKSIKDVQKKEKIEDGAVGSWRSETVLKVAMLAGMMILESCIDCSLSGLLISFIVKELNWLEEEALYVSSVLFFTSGATRLLAVVVSRFLPDVFIIIFDCVLGTVAVFILATLVHHHRCVIWVCVMALGAAYATIHPSTVAWAGNQVKVTGVITSVFMMPLGAGLIFGARVVGFVFQGKGPMWFAYMLCIYVVALDVLFILTFVICKIRPLKDMDNTEAVKEVKEDILNIENTC